MIRSPKDYVSVAKGWGWEEWVVNEDYCGKRMFVAAGKRCSWHFHVLKDEVLYVNEGLLLIEYGESDDLASAKRVRLNPEESFRVFPKIRHRFTAEIDTILFEFSTTHYESDSYRLVKGD